jgi:hypothetical protein
LNTRWSFSAKSFGLQKQNHSSLTFLEEKNFVLNFIADVNTE